MYQIISIIAFLVTLAVIVLHRIAVPSNKKSLDKPNKRRSLVGILRILVYLLALLCFVVLAVTGFYPTLVLGEHISGYLLMIHATFAPVFAICLAVLAVMWASRCRLNYSDWPWFQRLVRRLTLVEGAGEQAHCESSSLGQKITFWLIIFLALPLILSIVLSMFPLFGTHWQELFLSTHRWTALVFALIVIVHTYLLIRAPVKQ
jgi:cytochrome b subunit of formate dehydrogenase